MKTNKCLTVFFIIILCFIQNKIIYSQYYLQTQYNNGKATISAYYPNANSVSLRGTGGSWGLYNTVLNFVNTGNGIWKATTDSIDTGFHYYNMQVNGIITVNPNEKVYSGSNNWNNGLEIPDGNLDFYDFKEIDHGYISMQLYKPFASGPVRRCFIYLPPNYYRDLDSAYPVLYLQHGNGENEYSWHTQGKANIILDNLIAEGMAIPMIVVMNNNITYDVLLKLIPVIEENYRVKTGKENRAIAGLSMGGMQAADIVMRHPEICDYLGIFSGSPGTIFNSVANTQTQLVWLGWGNEDEYVSGWQGYSNLLDQNKINHETVIYNGAHQWQVWRKCLRDFAPLLFKPVTYTNPYPVIIENVENNQGVFVYPVPFNGRLFLYLGISEENTINLYNLTDISGRIILTLNDTKLNAEDHISDALQRSDQDMFILSVITKDKVYNTKIIK